MLLFITFLCEEEDERLLNGKLIGHELSLVMDLDMPKIGFSKK